MKTLITGLLICLAGLPLTGWGAEIRVEVSGLRNRQGQLMVGLYNRPEAFPDVGGKFEGVNLFPIEEGRNVAVFHVPPGTYAVAVIHDENRNGKLDKNFMKIPKEAYGFSNGAKGKFGPPPFSAASFVVGEEGRTVSVELNR